MGYNKIINLYKDSSIISLFKEVYATEKVHGSSAHISYNNGKVTFYAGGIKHKRFIECINTKQLINSLNKLGFPKIVVFGEVYGAECQGMAKTYGPNINFIAFEVKIDQEWLSVEEANKITDKLGLEFVPWVRGPSTLEFVDAQRDAPSEVAIRRGMGNQHTREGVVLRTIVEVCHQKKRFIAKHKHPNFRETLTPRSIDLEQQAKFTDAEQIAREYATPMRVMHVMDKFLAKNLQEDQHFLLSMKCCNDIINKTIKDIKEEEGDDIEWSKEVNKAIGTVVANILNKQLMSKKDWAYSRIPPKNIHTVKVRSHNIGRGKPMQHDGLL